MDMFSEKVEVLEISQEDVEDRKVTDDTVHDKVIEGNNTMKPMRNENISGKASSVNIYLGWSCIEAKYLRKACGEVEPVQYWLKELKQIMIDACHGIGQMLGSCF